MEVVEGVHKVDGVPGGNVYLLLGPELALVDAGWPGAGRAIVRYIRRLGREPRDLRHILLTHGHPDHTGAASYLRRLSGARVWAHPGDVKRHPHDGLWASYISQPFAVHASVPLFHRVLVDGLLEDGEALPIMGGLRVYHVPGHTSGSVALRLERHGVLFTGDTLLTHRTAFSRPLPLPGYDAQQYAASVRRLAALEFEVACGGHGAPVPAGASHILNQMLAGPGLDSYWANLRYRLARRLERRPQASRLSP